MRGSRGLLRAEPGRFTVLFASSMALIAAPLLPGKPFNPVVGLIVLVVARYQGGSP